MFPRKDISTMLNKKSVTSHNIGTAIFCLLAAFLFSSCSSMPSTDKNAPIASEQKETAQSSAAKKAWILASQENYDQAQNALNQLDRQHTLYPSETADIESLQDSIYFSWATALIIESDIDTAEDKSHINSQGLRLLNIIDIQANIDTLPIAEQIAFWDYKAKLYSKYSLIKYAIKSRIYVEHLQLSNNNPGNESFLHNHTQLWHLLHTLDAQDIQTL
ncbi:MAG: hypothetical protein KAG18_02875, partial [Sinobacterium sp.]|nr:hypothetical protein [Sinobacterium sp.]